MLIIPRAQVASAQPESRCKLGGEDHAGIDQTAEYEIVMAHKARKGCEQGGKPVYGEHPDGCGAWKMEVSSAKSMEGSKEEFQKPSQKPAVYIVVNKFSHNRRITGLGEV